MPEYKLIYFPVRGRAEYIRFLLVYGNIPYEEVSIKQEDWPTKFKPEMPFGQVPVLEVDGKKLAQSAAIGRYVAEELGLRGKTAWQRAYADMLVDAIHDGHNGVTPIIMARMGGDEAKVKELLETYKTNTVKPLLKNFSKLLAENEAKSGWFVGSELTWADISIAEFLEHIESAFFPGIIQTDAPELKAHQEKVYALPQIAAWVAKRPEDPFKFFTQNPHVECG